MINHVKLRKFVTDHKPDGTKRLDELLATQLNFLDFKKQNHQQELASVDFRKLDIFHRAVGPILTVAQCFALMPVVGVRCSNPINLRFTMRCPQAMWTLIFLLAGMIFSIAISKKLFRIGINAKNFVGLVFFFCVLCANMLFFSLANRWPNIIQYWTRVELIFLKKPYLVPKRNLTVRVQLAAAVIIFLSAVEHIMFFMSATYGYTSQIKLCNITQGPSFEHFMKQNYDYIFHMVPYNTVSGIATLVSIRVYMTFITDINYVNIINGTFTFIWNYMDLFIMMVSKGIAYRFEQITVRIKNLSDKEVSEFVFSEIREHYVQVCELLEYVDENLSGIILLSCMNNLYFVCYQLLNIFNKLQWTINYIYFWYSLLYLIGRTAFVFLSAASINDQSKAPVNILRKVSQKTWCIEVERLIFQMTTETVALSGKKFYFLTRRLLFGMAGTIVTYELVLLQFDEPNRSKGLPGLCT